MEALNKIIEEIESLELTTVKVGILSDGDSISVRPTPSSYINRYLKDGVFEFNFQVLTKNRNGQIAYDWLLTIEEHFENLQGDFILCEVTNSRQFVEETDKNEMIFTSLFKIEYIKEES